MPGVAVKLRVAQPDDAAAICAISNALIAHSLITFTTDRREAPATRAAIEDADGAFLVAEEAGRVVGFASYGPFRSGPGYARTVEHSIQLEAEARQRGIGQALMVELIETARRRDVHVMVAGISSANPAGLAFHAALGFEQVGHLREVGWKQGRWLDLIFMQKIL